MPTEEQLEKARKKVKDKKGFYSHLGVYIAVGGFFLAMNYLTYSEEPEMWWYFPLLPWGIGLAIHYFSVFGIPFIQEYDEDWEEKELAKELKKIQRREGYIEREDFDQLDINAPRKELLSDNDEEADFV